MKTRMISLFAVIALASATGCEWKFNGSSGVDGEPPLGQGQVGTACAANSDCESGAICDASSGSPVCTEAPTCDVSDDCDAGFSCDPRNTCVFTGTCSAEAPACDAGPGLYCNEARGTCEANDPSSVACEAIIDPGQCDDRADCAPVYAGIDCRTPDGTSCTSDAANCTCDSFVYDFCATL